MRFRKTVTVPAVEHSETFSSLHLLIHTDDVGGAGVRAGQTQRQVVCLGTTGEKSRLKLRTDRNEMHHFLLVWQQQHVKSTSRVPAQTRACCRPCFHSGSRLMWVFVVLNRKSNQDPVWSFPRWFGGRFSCHFRFKTFLVQQVKETMSR